MAPAKRKSDPNDQNENMKIQRINGKPPLKKKHAIVLKGWLPQEPTGLFLEFVMFVTIPKIILKFTGKNLNDFFHSFRTILYHPMMGNSNVFNSDLFFTMQV